MPERNYLGYDPKAMGLAAVQKSPLTGDANGQPMTQSTPTTPNYGLSSIQGGTTPAPSVPTTPTPTVNAQPINYGLTSAVTPPPSQTPVPAPAATPTATQPSAEATMRGMTDEELKAWQQKLNQPYVDPNIAKAAKPYQDQIAILTQKATAEAQEAERRAMGKARAMGSDLEIAQGLGQFAESEAMAAGGEAIAEVGAKEASAIQTAEKESKDNKINDLKDMIFNETATPEGRILLIDQIRQIDPDDPLVTLYDQDPDSFALQFNAQDLAAWDLATRSAAADMQQKIIDPLDEEQVKDYWNGGSYKKIRFPSDVKLTTLAGDYKPSDAVIAKYEELTGKKYDETSIESKKDVYAFSTWQKEFDSVMEQEIQTELVTKLTNAGIDTSDPSVLADIQKYSGVISKSIGESPIKVVIDGKTYTTDWNTDFEEGGLAPFYYRWDGTEYAPGDKPDQFDKNMDTMFYEYNTQLKKQGRDPVTMSQFRQLIDDKTLDQNNILLTQKPLTAAQKKILLGTIDKRMKTLQSETYRDIKLSTAEEVRTIQHKDQLSDATPSELKDIINDAEAVKAMEKVGVYTQANTTDTLGYNATSDAFAKLNINPGTTFITNDGKIYTVKRLLSWKDDEAYDKFGWELIGVDANGKEVVIASNIEEGADEHDVKRYAYDDGKGNWTGVNPNVTEKRKVDDPVMDVIRKLNPFNW